MQARGFQTVAVTRQEVAEFARHWPCFNLPIEEILFEFQINDSGAFGDLVDYTVNTGDIDEESSRALAAMAEDAKAGKIGQEVRP